MMLLSRFIFRKYGWGVAALITPSVLLITGVAFFVLVLFSGAHAHASRTLSHCAGFDVRCLSAPVVCI